jgi:hypothetical protein
MSLVACLCATNRPEWRPWLQYQFDKQTFKDKTLFINDDPIETLGNKRTRLLNQALKENPRYIAWFDDDDWSFRYRLQIAIEIMERNPTYEAVGNFRSYFVNPKTRKCADYCASEGIIFNGAVFRAQNVPRIFSAISAKEDTNWLKNWHLINPSYLIVAPLIHMWMCHDKNVTNRVTERSFDLMLQPNLISEEEWKLVPRS